MRGLAFFLILLMSWHCLAADFQVTAPPQWKKLEDGDDSPQVYKNSRSKTNESVTIHSFQMENPDPHAHQILHEKAKELTELRRRFLTNFGMREYVIISMERRKSTIARFAYMQVIQSSFIDIKGREVQALERQFLNNGKLFVITYLTDSPAMNDRERAERVLDRFQPQTDKSSRDPAAAGEILSAVGTSARVGASTYGSDAYNSYDLDIRDPRNRELCKGVPAEFRRTEKDKTFLGVATSMLWALPKCGQGAWDNFKNFWKGTASLISSDGQYLSDSAYRDQIHASAGAMASEFWKDKTGFLLKRLYAIRDFIAKQVGQTFFCLRPIEQIRAACDFATNFVAPGTAWKLMTKTPIVGPELANLASNARELVGKFAKAPKTSSEMNITANSGPPAKIAQDPVDETARIKPKSFGDPSAHPAQAPGLGARTQGAPGEVLQRAEAKSSELGLAIKSSGAQSSRFDHPITISRPTASPIAHKMHLMRLDFKLDFRLRPGINGDTEPFRAVRFSPRGNSVVPISPELLENPKLLREHLDRLDVELRRQRDAAFDFEEGISSGRASSFYRLPETTDPAYRKSVAERLRAMGFDVEQASTGASQAERLEFSVRTARDGRHIKFTGGAGDLARAVKNMREKHDIDFRMQYNPTAGLAERSEVLLGSMNAKGKPSLTVNLGRDFLENPEVAKENLLKIKRQFDAFAHAEENPNLKIVTKNVDLESADVRAEILVPGNPTSGPLLWIKNRQNRHGVRVFIQDELFSGDSSAAHGFAEENRIFLRSSVFQQPQENVEKLIAHELQHAVYSSRCQKNPEECWRIMSFVPKEEGEFARGVSGYKNGFRGDELEAYKIEGSSEIGERFGPDQLRLLEEAKKQILQGRADLTRSRPYVDVPARIQGSEKFPAARINFESSVKFKDPREAAHFYLKQIDRRIKAVKTIGERDYRYASLGRKRPGFFDDITDKAQRMEIIESHLSSLGLRAENKIRPFGEDAVSFDIVPSYPLRTEFAEILNRIRYEFGARFEGNNFDPNKTRSLGRTLFNFDRPVIPINPVMYDSPYIMKKELLALEGRLRAEKSEAMMFESTLRHSKTNELYQMPDGPPADVKTALAARLKSYGLNSREIESSWGEGKTSWALEVGGRSEDARLMRIPLFANYRNSLENLRQYGAVRFLVKSEEGKVPRMTTWNEVVDPVSGGTVTTVILGEDFFRTPTVVFKAIQKALSKSPEIRR